MSAQFRKKNTILVLYPPGGYGTFLHWCLLYFTDRFPDGSLPFKENGSSHGAHLPVFDCLLYPPIAEYFESDQTFPIIRSHGKLSDSFYIDRIIDYVDKIVLLEPDISTRLLLINNTLTKTTRTQSVVLKEVCEKLSETFGADPKNVPYWQLREMVSYWYEGLFLRDYQYKDLVNDKIIKVSIRNLVDHLLPTLEKILDQLGLSFCRRDQFDEIEKKWLDLQRFKDVDRLCRQIIDCTRQGIEFTWSAKQLGIIEEAYIQFELRTVYNLDLKCYNLDVFPNSSLDLKELLIHV